VSIAPSLGVTWEAENARVRALEELGVLGTAPEERFDRITRMAQRMFGVQSVMITLITHDRQWYKSAQGTGVTSASRTDAFCNHTIRQPNTLVVEDATADPRFARNPYVTGEPGVRFYAGHPIEAPGGHRVGTLCLVDARARTFDHRERAQLQHLASWVQTELQSTAEMDRAAEVQRGLHPHATALVVPGYQLAGVCLASRTVGGDLLDWYYAPDGDVVVTLGDVMGKGMGAAIMMATVRGAMRAAGRLHPPAEAVRQAAATLEEDLQETGTLVTMCHARVTPATGVLAFADAGHGLCLLIGADGTVYRSAGGGLPLGVSPDERWPQLGSVLGPGDTLVSFSDGLLDLYDDTVETAVDEVVRVTRRSHHASAVVDHFAGLARASHLTDDVTLFALRRSP
jgi:serine phosphatase RsbU (regulator of sigma subunit)